MNIYMKISIGIIVGIVFLFSQVEFWGHENILRLFLKFSILPGIKKNVE